MKTTTASKLRSELASYLQQTQPVVVTQNGRMTAVLVPIKSKDDVERFVMANNAELMKLLDDASRRVKKSGGIPHDEFWKRIDAKYEKKSNGRHKRKVGK